MSRQWNLGEFGTSFDYGLQRAVKSQVVSGDHDNLGQALPLDS
jgi:hypothetical protein